tara:strand:- start:174 stop:314 length:141 start_codon:yes stop_codon:yes gene_type:complete
MGERMSDLNNKDKDLEDKQDSKVDAIAALVLIMALVVAAVIWVSSQ